MISLLALGLILPVKDVCASQTVWCRVLNIGCDTSEEREKKLQNCTRMADQTYRSALSLALSDPTVWQFQGSRSAEDYAEMRRRGMLSICLQREGLN